VNGLSAFADYLFRRTPAACFATAAIIGFESEKISYWSRKGWSWCIHFAGGVLASARTMGWAQLR
jgi:hypothetical protein